MIWYLIFWFCKIEAKNGEKLQPRSQLMSEYSTKMAVTCDCKVSLHERLKAGPVRGVSAQAGKRMARAESIQILQALAVAFQTGLRE